MAKSSGPKSPLKYNDKTRRVRSCSQKRWLLQSKELDENGMHFMDSVGAYERCIFHLSVLTYPKYLTFLRILMLLQTEQDCLNKECRV